MLNISNLSNDVDHFLSFISQEVPVDAEQVKKRIVSFFSDAGNKNPYVIHDHGDLLFYSDEKLTGSSPLENRNTHDAIYRFDGTRISSLSPYANQVEYLMISGKKKKGTGGGSSGGGVSSNNNNNNNNNNG